MSGDREDRWREADALFREALDRPPPEQEAFLDAACGDDAGLRDEVSALLRAASESDGFLARPVDALASVPWDRVLTEVGRRTRSRGRPDTDRSGERVGAYRLIRTLGRGGMATVYLAERADGLWEQEVALKIVRRGLDTEDVVRRFHAERQILSTLNHPNIARLLDGGTTDDGLPFLVMEHVEGTPITTYCDTRTLPLDDRLRLFCDVGRAVQHAHRALVVHRDLKPSNILVTGTGRVKLLDFGIAKILDPAADDVSTRTGLRPLTPECASPEQVGGGAVTTASDVYQLGLLLSELLSGRRPYEIRRPHSPAGLEAFFDRVEPAPPSALVTAEAAAARSEGAARLEGELRGDLDTIVLRALPKDPARRYASAAALVADVERYRQELPIAARPATLAYRTRKLLGRRPWLLPAVAAALLVLAGYVATLVRHSDQLERERNLARSEAERAEEVQGFLVDVFRSADPYATNGDVDRDVTVREALALGADRVRVELAGRPVLQGTLLAAIGDVYANLDLVDRARDLQEEALSLQREAHGPASAQVARRLRTLGTLTGRKGHSDSAEALLLRSLEIARALDGPRDTAVAGVLTDLGDLATRQGRPDLAEKRLVEAVDLLRGRDPRPAAHLAAAYTELVDVYPMLHRMEEARAAAGEAARLSRIAFGEDHPRSAMALVQLADLHDWDGTGASAVPIYRDAIAVLDRSLGAEHEQTLQARNNLAVTLRHLGELEAAERVHREILATWRAKRGARDRNVGDALQNLAVVLRERGRLEEAERRLEEARDVYDSVLEPGHFARAYPRLTLAAVRIDHGDFAAAERAAREAAGILAASFPESSYVTATARCRLGRALDGQGRRAEARELLEPSVETLARTAQPSARYQIECRRALAELYRSLGREELARPQTAAIRKLERRDGGGS